MIHVINMMVVNSQCIGRLGSPIQCRWLSLLLQSYMTLPIPSKQLQVVCVPCSFFSQFACRSDHEAQNDIGSFKQFPMISFALFSADASFGSCFSWFDKAHEVLDMVDDDMVSLSFSSAFLIDTPSFSLVISSLLVDFIVLHPVHGTEK